MTESIDLGMEHTIEFVVNSAGKRVGLVYRHPSPNDQCARVGNYIGLDPEVNTPSATWAVESWDPLTLSPSLACRRCGDHGFIRGGKWVPA